MLAKADELESAEETRVGEAAATMTTNHAKPPENLPKTVCRLGRIHALLAAKAAAKSCREYLGVAITKTAAKTANSTATQPAPAAKATTKESLTARLQRLRKAGD